MAKIVDVYNYIDTFAPFDTAMDGDNVGMLVGDENAEVKRAVIALDITPETVYEARERSAQLIVSHHPIIFHPMKRLVAGSTAYLLAESGIGAICAHTNLDFSCDGTNVAMFNTIGLQGQEPLESCGGLVGTLSEAVTARELAEKIKKSFNCEGLRYSDCGEKIKRVAVAAGAAGEGIFAASSHGAQAFVTGEIKHHEILFARENGIAIFDVGHRKCEELVVPVLYRRLSGKFPEIEFYQSEKYTDGIRYL